MSESDPVSRSEKDARTLCVRSYQFLISHDLHFLVVEPVGSEPEESPANFLRIERGQTVDNALESDQASAGFITVWVELSEREQAKVRIFWNKVVREVRILRQIGDFLAQAALLLLLLEAYAIYRHGWAAWTNWIEFVFLVLWIPALAVLSHLIVCFLSWLVEGLFKRLLHVPADFGWPMMGLLSVLLGVSFVELTRRIALTAGLSAGLAVMKALHDIGITAAGIIIIKVFHGAWHYARLFVRERDLKR